MTPYAIYVPEPYGVTHVNKSFPEHHLPLEHTRHRIGHAWHDWWNPLEPPYLAPKADVRETLDNYYIDVELPGTESKDQVLVKWTNHWTLLVEATKTRIPIPEDAEPISQPVAEDANGDAAGKEKEQKAPEHRVHSLVRERGVGKVARAFSFPVKVDCDRMTAKLQHGVLILTVPKAEEAKVEHKEVEVVQSTG